MMKFSLFLLAAFVFCLGGKVETVKSTSQQWVGGIRESGYGTDYRITVKVSAGSSQLAFGDLWVDGVHMKVRMSDASNLNLKEFAGGSTVILRGGVTYKPDELDRTILAGADSLAPPVEIKGRGLLSYTYKGKKKYLQIAGFEKLEKIIYP